MNEDKCVQIGCTGEPGAGVSRSHLPLVLHKTHTRDSNADCKEKSYAQRMQGAEAGRCCHGIDANAQQNGHCKADGCLRSTTITCAADGKSTAFQMSLKPSQPSAANRDHIKHREGHCDEVDQTASAGHVESS